jgi:Flp pilus assembly protein TadG
MLIVRQTGRNGRPASVVGRRQGAFAAELAIVLPLLVFMLVIAVDFCRVYYCCQVVEACTESGALYASENARRNPNTTTDDSDAAIQAAVAEGTTLNPPLTAASVSVTTGSGTATVTVTYQLNLVTSFPGMPARLTITRSTTMTMAPQVGQ